MQFGLATCSWAVQQTFLNFIAKTTVRAFTLLMLANFYYNTHELK